MSDIHDPVLGILVKNLRVDGSYSCRIEMPDGIVKGHFQLHPDSVPSTNQITLMSEAVLNAQSLKRKAVAFVRYKVLTVPNTYGLLDENGEPVEWAAPYFYMNEQDYFDDFRLSSMVVDGNSTNEILLNFDTELDPEHGVPVLFRNGIPIEAFA